MNRDRLVAILVSFVVICISAYLVVSGILARSTSGVLNIQTSDPTATLAISQVDHKAQYIGLDNARVRLATGQYLVSATDQRTTVWVDVNIQKGQSISKSLDINSVKAQANIYNEIVAKLPYTGPGSEYTIDYYLKFENGQSTPVFRVSYTSDKAKQDAISWFDYYGFDTSQLPIVYEGMPAIPGGYNAFQ